MSPRAIDARLKLVEQLRRLCLSLKAAGEAHRKKAAHDKNPTLSA